MLTITDGDTMVQAICKNPPWGPWTKWRKSRMEFYMRFEPNAPLRDVPPRAVGEVANHRVRMDGMASDILWEAILSNPDQQLMANLEKLFENTKASSSSSSS